MSSSTLPLPRRITHVLLDLDGTLTDSAPGIVSSLRTGFAAAGLAVPSDDVLLTFVGPALGTSMARVGLSDDDATAVIDAYRRSFEAGGMFENSLFPGIPEALTALREAGVTLAIATAKPEVYALRIVEHFGLDVWLEGGLDGVFGAELEGAGVSSGKGPIIARALAALGAGAGGAGGSGGASAAGPAGVAGRTVMVGDREHDAEGAAENGIATIGARWGYADPGELEAAGVAAFADSPEGLVKLVLG
ncbi:HAD hydrolase-like protein [Antribacter gilvus]|uniref:HAD hydrolase-like protein n=1 Tax=Antribacter gilvus TaxID=2304675 RepID=UPI0013E04D85|nr:HAD hydrolase-like protein [Antribacter gilvus]